MKGTVIFLLPEYLQEDGIRTVAVASKFPPGKERIVISRLREDVADEYSAAAEKDIKFGCLFLHDECEAITDLSEL